MCACVGLPPPQRDFSSNKFTVCDAANYVFPTHGFQPLLGATRFGLSSFNRSIKCVPMRYGSWERRVSNPLVGVLQTRPTPDRSQKAGITFQMAQRSIGLTAHMGAVGGIASFACDDGLSIPPSLNLLLTYASEACSFRGLFRASRLAAPCAVMGTFPYAS